MNKVYGIIFKDGSKTYFFKGNDSYKKEDYVVVDTEKGLQYARIVQVYDDKAVDESLKEIVRLSTDKDTEKYLKNLRARASVNIPAAITFPSSFLTPNK